MAPGSQMKLLAIAMATTCAAASLASGTTMAKNSAEEYYVQLHNAARAVAGAGPVSWDSDAAQHAAKLATRVCAGLRSSSPGVGGGYGENVFRGMPGKDWAEAAADALRAWTAPTASEYVQVIWPGSNRIGCAHALCPGGRTVVVRCSYKPAVKEDLRRAPLPSYCRYNISRCYDCPIC